MGFYSFISNDIIDKNEIEKIVKQAKLDRLHSVAKKLEEYEPLNEDFIKAILPDETTNEVVIEKRAKKVNKLKIKCQQKRLKKMLG